MARELGGLGEMFTQPVGATFTESTVSDVHAQEKHMGKLGPCC